MTTATIEELAYLMKEAKKANLPQPIVFLGAGASKTGGVPLVGDIIKDILEIYKDSPKIKFLKEEERTYPKLMECLAPFERNKLLKGYIDEAKVNVTHIYLAQLLMEGYIDYVLTVNFDNLMLRALALFNYFPPTYDMAVLKDLTTTSFKEKSVVYLHGQHHGLWLLNTVEEMARVNEIIPPILDSIKNQRPWIFIGYSGDDPIFKHIQKLGRFDNGLFWVTYHDNNPNDSVCKGLLEKANTNASLIKGYDADAFMLKLNSELKLPEPLIIGKPFTSLKESLNNIVDIDDKKHFKGVKERLEVAKNNVRIAIEQFEEGVFENVKDIKEDIDVGLLKKDMINIIVREIFDEEQIQEIERRVAVCKNEEAHFLLSELFNNWGNTIGDLARQNKDVNEFKSAIEKYEKAILLDPKNNRFFYNIGSTISDLASLIKDTDKFKLSFEYFEKSISLDDTYFLAYNNWGNALLAYADLVGDEIKYFESISKYKKAFELDSKSSLILYNWGLALAKLAMLKKDVNLYNQAFDRYSKSAELNPNNEEVYFNWGTAIIDLARLTKENALYYDSFDKFKRVIEINPRNIAAYNNWTSALLNLGKLTRKKEFYIESIKKSLILIELGGSSYNLACAYALLNEKTDAFETLNQSLQKKEIAVEHVKNDDDWQAYRDDEDFIALLKKYE